MALPGTGIIYFLFYPGSLLLFGNSVFGKHDETRTR